MPNPIISKGFTPTVDGTVIVTATYSVQQFGTASDWGSSSPGSQLQQTKDSTSVVLASGPFVPCSRTRMPQTQRTTFSVLASNGAQTFALYASGGAAGTSITFWDVDMTLEFIKR